MIQVSAIVLAAGLSSRMGQPKMLLPWNGSTVIQSVVWGLSEIGLDEIVIVTGALRDEIGYLLESCKVKIIFNPQYENGEMLASFQLGLQQLSHSDAALLMLGDQPQISKRTILDILSNYQGQKILIPSYNMRRGHPWIIHRSIWPDIISLNPPKTMRDITKGYSQHISYLNVDDPMILNDIDTPEDYAQLRKE